MDEYEEAILFTFGELESRLDRLEYILNGPGEKTEERPKTIPDRMHRIEQSLQALGGKTSLLADAHKLLSQHKDVLTPQDDYNQSNIPLDVHQKAALVVDRAPAFATTASQLKTLADQQISTTDGFAKLAMLRPQIAEMEERHLQQALKISELRRRNMLVNQCYKHVHLLGAGRAWADYQKRLTKALQEVERQEFKRRDDDEMKDDEEEDDDDDDEL